MVRHQAVGMNVAALRTGNPPQMMEIKRAVLVIGKASRSIVAPLNGVDRYTRNDHASASGHPQVNVDRERPLTRKRGLSLF
jgi:hypothetical protein